MNTDHVTVNTQSSIRIRGSKTVYFDPFRIGGKPQDADLICITHVHSDHFDPESIEKVRKKDTVILAPHGMKKETERIMDPKYIRLLAPGDEAVLDSITVTGVPAYNRIKPFHPKRNKWLGYLLAMDGITYYIAGDTDAVKEVRDIRCDIAFVPIGGTFTMTAKEAAGLVNLIRPGTAIPVHYGSIVGNRKDAEVFRSLADQGIEVIEKL